MKADGQSASAFTHTEKATSLSWRAGPQGAQWLSQPSYHCLTPAAPQGTERKHQSHDLLRKTAAYMGTITLKAMGAWVMCGRCINQPIRVSIHTPGNAKNKRKQNVSLWGAATCGKASFFSSQTREGQTLGLHPSSAPSRPKVVVHGRLRQKDCKFEVNLGYTVRPIS